MTPVEPLTLWTGWDFRRGASAPPDVREVFGDPEAPGDARYELLAVAARGFRPPQFLTVVDLADHLGGELHEAVTAGASDEVVRQTWSMAYRQVAETAPKGVVPHAIYLLGVNPPEDATDEELVAFNDFYTNVHLHEVAERRHLDDAAELERALCVLSLPDDGAGRRLSYIGGRLNTSDTILLHGRASPRSSAQAPSPSSA